MCSLFCFLNYFLFTLMLMLDLSHIWEKQVYFPDTWNFGKGHNRNVAKGLRLLRECVRCDRRDSSAFPDPTITWQDLSNTGSEDRFPISYIGFKYFKGYVCVCVHVCLLVSLHTRVPLCGGQRSVTGVFFNHSLWWLVLTFNLIQSGVIWVKNLHGDYVDQVSLSVGISVG